MQTRLLRQARCYSCINKAPCCVVFKNNGKPPWLCEHRTASLNHELRLLRLSKWAELSASWRQGQLAAKTHVVLLTALVSVGGVMSPGEKSVGRRGCQFTMNMQSSSRGSRTHLITCSRDLSSTRHSRAAVTFRPHVMHMQP